MNAPAEYDTLFILGSWQKRVKSKNNLGKNEAKILKLIQCEEFNNVLVFLWLIARAQTHFMLSDDETDHVRVCLENKIIHFSLE